jgi:hypothetical protein
MIAVDEVRPNFSQIARSDWLTAAYAHGLWAGRSAIHQNESHLPPPNPKRNAASTEHCSGILNFGKKSAGASPRSLSGGLKSTQPFAVAVLARLEAVNAFLRTDGGSPGVVSYEAELSAADRAPLGCAVPGLLGNASHRCLLWTLRGWLVLAPHFSSHLAQT